MNQGHMTQWGRNTQRVQVSKVNPLGIKERMDTMGQLIPLGHGKRGFCSHVPRLMQRKDARTPRARSHIRTIF